MNNEQDYLDWCKKLGKPVTKASYQQWLTFNEQLDAGTEKIYNLMNPNDSTKLPTR